MKKFLFAVVFFLQISCSQVPLFKFKEPQPPDLIDLPYIPEQYYGKYLSTKDSSIITINPKLIIQEWNEYSEIEKSKMKEILDTIYDSNKLIKLGQNWTMTILIKNDSVKMSTYQIDTLFQMSGNKILRSFKGQLFINEKEGKYWSVDIVVLRDNKLEIGTLTEESKLLFLETIPEQTILLDSTKSLIPKIIRKVKPEDIRKVKTNSQFYNRI
jgi:hypothetical protein